MESHIPEESVSAEISLLRFLEQNFADRIDHLVELGLDDIAQLKTTCTLFRLDLMVVRQVYGNGLSARIGITGIVDGVIHEHIRLRSRDKSLVGIRTRKRLLQVRKHRDILGQFLGLLEVLEQNEALIRRLDAMDTVLIVLDRADHEVHLAVLHIHPGIVGLQI